jgi:hypothetical protein
MDHWDDHPDRAEIDPPTDLVGLWTASDPEELWRILVLHSDRSTTEHWLAVRLFRRHHDDGTPGALTTASLLCTDHRWDRCTARLIAGIAETSLLSKDDLDELAARFLWSDRFRFEYPLSWIGTEWFSIDVTGGGGGVSGPVVHLDPDTPVPTVRFIQPPLRRWSARRVLRADPGSFDAIRDRAAELGTRDGGAVISGMLDALEGLSHDVARQAIDLGLGWPHGSVRLLALDLLAAVDLEGAGRRAAADPDAKVRNWTLRRARKRDASVRDGDRRPGKAKTRSHRHPQGDQAELFAEQETQLEPRVDAWEPRGTA